MIHISAIKTYMYIFNICSNYIEMYVSSLIKMHPYMHKQTQIDTNGPRWTQMDPDGPKWTKMDQNGHKWTKMDQNGPKWTKMDQNRPKFHHNHL